MPTGDPTNFEIGPPDRDLYFKAGSVPYLKLSTAGSLTAVNSGGISGAAITAGTIPQSAITAGTNGTWAAQTHVAGHYTGNGSMTVTVAVGDLGASDYAVINKVLIWKLVLTTVTVGGTPSTQIIVTVPGGLSCAGAAQGAYYYADNNVPGIGLFQLATATTVAFQKIDASNWTASTDLTAIRAEIILQLA